MNNPAVVFATVLSMSALVSFLITGRVRRYVLSRGILDRPNARSSHQVPTPRGGGLAIVVVVLGGTVLLAAGGWVSPRFAAAFVVGGAMVAAVGWLDDLSDLPALTRAIIHTVAVGWAVAWLGGVPSLTLGAWTVSFGAWGLLLGLVAMVWLINLYNFMDGIDGFAGTEAVFVAVAAGAFAVARGDTGLALVAFLVGGATLGFLRWNWPPAKIFMGDVGSGFLGYAFAVMAVAGERTGSVPALVWCVLLAVFLVDATLTLIRRILRGERWYEAHRTHVYQLAVRAGRTHKEVALAVLGTNTVLAAVAATLWAWPATGQWVALGAILVLGTSHASIYRRYASRLSPAEAVAPDQRARRRQQ